jgi:enoyl-CoA hydratase/carnithine racemase
MFMILSSDSSKLQLIFGEQKMVIKYEKQGHVATLTLNRPEVMNAINSEMFYEMHKSMVDFRDDPNLWVAIITGEGDKAFSAGADIKETLPLIRECRNEDNVIASTIIRGLEIYKPFICAVNGIAYGCGCELALACDLVIASENATFSQPEIRVGAMPGAGGTQRLTRFIPRCKASEMLLMAKIINAQEALRIGLVNEVVPLDKLMTKALEYANTICQMAPLAVQATKEAMIKGADLPLAEGLSLEKALFNEIVATADFEEGSRAFREKRKPDFKGK